MKFHHTGKFDFLQVLGIWVFVQFIYMISLLHFIPSNILEFEHQLPSIKKDPTVIITR